VNRIILKSNWGIIKPTFCGDDRLSNVAYLLRDTVIEYVRFNTHFSETVPDFDFPIGWGELQNQGVVYHSFFHALANKRKNGDCVFAEYPFELNKYKYKEQPEGHRLDFWVLLGAKRGKNEKATVLLVEYKHRWAFVRKSYLYEDWRGKKDKPLLAQGSLATVWRQDNEKLSEKATAYRSVRSSFLPFEPSRCKLVTMTLMTVLVCQDSLDPGELKGVHESDFESQLERTVQRLDSDMQPDWRAYWWLPETRQKEEAPWYDEDKRKHHFYYRGAYFLARLKSVQ